MKSIFAVVVILLVPVALSACSSDKSNASSNSKRPTKEDLIAHIRKEGKKNFDDKEEYETNMKLKACVINRVYDDTSTKTLNVIMNVKSSANTQSLMNSLSKDEAKIFGDAQQYCFIHQDEVVK